jgi:DNA-binding NarL/FixJ family response regulator
MPLNQTNQADILAQVRSKQPRIVLLGVGLYHLAGFRLLPHIRRALPDSLIIVLGPLDMEAFRQAALAAGADAFILKAALIRDVIPTIEQMTGITATYTSSAAEAFSALSTAVLPDHTAPHTNTVWIKSLSQPAMMQEHSLMK